MLALPPGDGPDTCPPVENDEFISQVDVAAVLGQFLNGLHDDDILTELLQNELDQRSTRTIVSFEPDRLVVEGDGAPVDDDGWVRLTYVAGAGGDVAAKPLGFGVKNHGLRACFMLGDYIHVRSSGRRILLTACKNGTGTFLAPGSWRHAQLDAEAPARGCRIEVPYRRIRLPARGGDLPPLEPPTGARLAAIWSTAVEQLPRRFMGAIRPDSIAKWTVELRHWELGGHEVRFEVVHRGRLLPRNVFRRRATSTSGSGRPGVVDEEVWTFDAQPPRADMRIPSFFRAGRKIRCDVAWEVDSRGAPRHGLGHLRYPIGYAGGGPTASTGVALHYAAPFVSDGARHGLGDGQKELNAALVGLCEQEVVRALRSYLVKRHGPASLSLLEGTGDGVSAPAALIHEAVRQGAAAIEPRSSARAKATKRWKLLAPAGTVLVPVARGTSTWSRRLFALAPKGLECIHSETPSFVLAVLGGSAPPGQSANWHAFDEHDVLTLMCVAGVPARFSWGADAAHLAAAADPDRCGLVLDLLENAGEDVRHYAKTLLEKLLLPDDGGVPRPWTALRRVRVTPPQVPGLAMPHFVHTAISRHPILVRSNLKLRLFDLDEHLAQLDAAKWSTETRGRFFAWLLGHRGDLSPAARARLASQPIWPSVDGQLVRLTDFCRPADEAVAEVLGASLLSPSVELARSAWVRFAARRGVTLRTAPTDTEIAAWFAARLAQIPVDGITADELGAGRIDRFEADLVALLGTSCGPAIRKLLPKLRTLDRTGVVRLASSLHVEVDEVRRCHLMPGDVAAGERPNLYVAAGARSKPSREALVRALSKDASRVAVVWDRLEAWRNSLPGQEPANELQFVPIFEVMGQLCSPARVFVPGREFGSWWGTWRVPMATDLTPLRKTCARRAGAVGAEPTPEWSREYFTFLAAATPDTVEVNLRPVVRHLQHRDGPLSWWEQHPNLPCVPFHDREHRIALVALRELAKPNNPYFVADFGDPELEDQVLECDSAVRFAVTSVRDLQVYLSEKLKEKGVRSLREAMNEPSDLQAIEPGPVAERYAGVLRGLQSKAQLDRIRAAMDVAGVRMSLLRTRWQAAIQRIREVRLAGSVRLEWVFRRHKYHSSPHSAVDRAGTLWLTEGSIDVDAAFFEALSKEMFGPTAPAMYGFALKAAVATAHEAFVPRRRTIGAQLDLPFFADDAEPAPEPRKEDHAAHGPIEVNPALNLPSPAPLAQENGSTPTGGSRRGGRGGRGRGGSTPSSRPVHDLELEHIESLKRHHYAWHCQICLGAHEPAILAPRLSYVATAELRRGLMEAHHVQHYRVGGARHGANLLVLCELHHANTGDRLTRGLIVSALANGSEVTARIFGDGADGTAQIVGTVIRLRIDGHSELVPMFFTDDHAKAWRELIP